MAVRYLFDEDGNYCSQFDARLSTDSVCVYRGDCVAAIVLGSNDTINEQFKLPTSAAVVIPESRMIDIAATVYSESSDEVQEAEGVTMAILNRVKYRTGSGSPATEPDNRFWGTEAFCGADYKNGIKGRHASLMSVDIEKGVTQNSYDTLKGHDLDDWIDRNYVRNANVSNELAWVVPHKMRTILKGVVRALVSKKDISRGAYFWENTASLERKTHDWRRFKWVGGGDPHYYSWSEKFQPVFIWIVDLGRTSFFRYNWKHDPLKKSKPYP